MFCLHKLYLKGVKGTVGQDQCQNLDCIAHRTRHQESIRKIGTTKNLNSSEL